MSSILTNNSSMIALQSLRQTNLSLTQVQSEISTGKRISNAKDNSAIWAISTVMTTDAESFKTIRNSLDLASSTVGVARSAAEQVTSLLQDMKSLIIAAQEESGRSLIQADINELRAQISGIVNAAQFNGQNLLKGGGSISVVASLDRASDQSVSAALININRVDLQAIGGVMGTVAIVAGAGLATASGASIAAAGSQTVTLNAGNVATGNSFRVVIGGTDTIEYISRENDTMNDVVRNLKSLIDARSITGISVDITQVADPGMTNSVLTIRNANAGAVSLAASSFTGGTPGGGLGALAGIDVETSDVSAASALTAIDGLITTSINAAAALGSFQKRIDNQGEFMTTLVDSITAGVGTITDADMEAASARLQALQVQQQLGIQALSIANQSAQTLLTLFRN
ncbi:MAG: flagellin [Hyphomonas sp.]|uniref:flagellin N-terminal helical domain-containing protein n=1 Tax=Hyphomonas sp. TaxID=87 RepID=UPI0034A07F12